MHHNKTQSNKSASVTSQHSFTNVITNSIRPITTINNKCTLTNQHPWVAPNSSRLFLLHDSQWLPIYLTPNDSQFIRLPKTPNLPHSQFIWLPIYYNTMNLMKGVYNYKSTDLHCCSMIGCNSFRNSASYSCLWQTWAERAEMCEGRTGLQSSAYDDRNPQG